MVKTPAKKKSLNTNGNDIASFFRKTPSDQRVPQRLTQDGDSSRADIKPDVVSSSRGSISGSNGLRAEKWNGSGKGKGKGKAAVLAGSNGESLADPVVISDSDDTDTVEEVQRVSPPRKRRKVSPEIILKSRSRSRSPSDKDNLPQSPGAGPSTLPPPVRPVLTLSLIHI